MKKAAVLQRWCNEALRPHDMCDRGTSSTEATRMRNLDVGLHGYKMKDKIGVGSIISCKFVVRVW